MQITLESVAVAGRREPLLEPFDLTWSTGECVLVAAEPGHGHTALALVATGRLQPSAGRVVVDGAADRVVTGRPRRLRDATAVVDVPGVNEPDDALTLGDVVAEGLVLAGRRALPRDVTGWVAEHHLEGLRGRRIDQLPPAVRVEVLAELAAADPAVRMLVLTLPDRHGGSAHDWWGLAQRLAERGLGVLVGCTRPSARALGVALPPATGDSHTPPAVALRWTPPAPPPAEDDTDHTHTELVDTDLEHP
ncbi:hypothetical protein [Cellulomonas massiliensis]|uniref:hypothetical protein n=1 Tax=Cellulomonas massiliensis TaxID=1465811 RepID=UPI00037EB67E|nr:hypothetical protein [Cellulomonas massiliensis]